MHYDYTLEIIDPSTLFYEINIKKLICLVKMSAILVKAWSQEKYMNFNISEHFRKNALLKCSNLKRISLPCNFDLHNFDLIHNTT